MMFTVSRSASLRVILCGEGDHTLCRVSNCATLADPLLSFEAQDDEAAERQAANDAALDDDAEAWLDR